MKRYYSWYSIPFPGKYVQISAQIGVVFSTVGDIYSWLSGGLLAFACRPSAFFSDIKILNRLCDVREWSYRPVALFLFLSKLIFMHFERIICHTYLTTDQVCIGYSISPASRLRSSAVAKGNLTIPANSFNFVSNTLFSEIPSKCSMRTINCQDNC